jgi:cellulase
VVTQFPTNDETDSGSLVEIRRLYIQDGQTISNSLVDLDDHSYDSLTPDFCKASNAKSFHNHGGLAAMGEALKRGMVLIMGIWGGEYMTWLDSGDAGPCKDKEDRSSFIKAHSPNTRVTFGKIRWGDIGSTTCDI